MATLPRLALLSTGGTIAGVAPRAIDTTGYRAGAIDAAGLLAAVPGAEALADIDVESVLAIDSKDMTPAHWLTVAQRLSERLARDDCDGVVVTHGTDTLAETAFFLHCVLPAGKPVVLTAAMRPATALSADGPMNLYEAIAVAASPAARDRGVLVVTNDCIFAARHVIKAHTRALQAIAAPERGPLGSAMPVRFVAPPSADNAGVVPLADLGAAALPRVDIFYVAAGSPPDLLATAAERGVAGVVLALPGHGSLPDYWFDAVRAAQAAGVQVVRSSHVARGPVSDAVIDGITLRGSSTLGALKARIALMLALAVGKPDVFATLAA